MEFPYVIERDAQKYHSNFLARFNGSRAVKETVWRRHQSSQNKSTSLWESENDARRRLFHVRDKYNYLNDSFVLEQTYMYMNVKNTKDEIDKYLDAIEDKRKEGGWTKVDDWLLRRGHLICSIELRDYNPYDVHYDFPILPNYKDLEVRIFSRNFFVDDMRLTRHTPWHVLKTAGIRQIVKRGNPTEITREDLGRFFPAHIELGCGPSIEASIPPLYYLHNVYGIMTDKKDFVFNQEDDNFLTIFSDPEKKFQEITHIHLMSLKAEPTPFYHKLKALVAEGKVLGPILTNNFDGLALSAGLDELFMREYDKMATFPAIEFDKSAKSLLVIGCHADRRTCQEQARKHGLKIVHIDPEGYFNEDGFKSYPLEAPQDEDYILRLAANSIFV